VSHYANSTEEMIH